MDANTKTNQEDLLAKMGAKIDTNCEALQEEMMKTNQEKADADREHNKEIMET
jgi:hypothetical protein